MTEPMTPEQLRAQIEQLDAERLRLLGEMAKAGSEIDRLRKENERAMECFDRDQKVIADLQAENRRQRAALGKFVSNYLNLLMDDRLEDGSLVLETVFDLNPELADQLRTALSPSDEVQA